MNLKELRAVSHLLAIADPWPLSLRARQVMIGLMRQEDRTEKMNLEQLKVVIMLFIAADWTKLDQDTWKVLYELADKQSRSQGFDDWTEVYELTLKPVSASNVVA